jgi:UDP-N-acetylmuramoylalanine--D-glutamate ligase
MLLRDLAGKKICILGFGREGEATLRAIERAGIKTRITIADKSDVLSDSTYEHHCGATYLDDLAQFDIIIKSPGIKLHPKLDAVRSKITNATQIFLDEANDRDATVIGVTGTKGKSTTSSLIYEILRAATKDVHLVGNIGKPALAYLDHAKKGAIFVMELSSYQLMDVTTSPHVAVFINLYDEHLDYHGSRESYIKAKQNIFRYQNSDDVLFYCAILKPFDIIPPEEEIKSKVIAYDSHDCPVRMEETKLIGMHNIENMAAASKVASYLAIDQETIKKALHEFSPLPHRLQNLGMHHGIIWIDHFPGSIILGGQDRGLDFASLAKRIATSSIHHVILFGEDSARIGDAIKTEHPSINLHPATSMQEVVSIAKDVTPKGAVCLLSPASPSYDMFKNFEEKGDAFTREIRR